MRLKSVKCDGNTRKIMLTIIDVSYMIEKYQYTISTVNHQKILKDPNIKM